MKISEIKSYDQIHSAIAICSSDFYDQSLNNKTDIEKLATKFTKYAKVAVAYKNDEPAGFISYYCNDKESKTAYVSMIIIRSAFQGTGVGTLLFNHMIDDCVSNGFFTIKLEVATSNDKAIRFYIKKGFEKSTSATENSDYYELKL